MNRSHSPIAQRHRAAIALSLCVLLALAVASTPAQPAAAAAPELRLSAPAQVGIGQAIPITLTVSGAADLAGYEALVLFDTGAAEFAGLYQLANSISAIGRGIGSLSVATMPAGSAIGLYSCPTASCVERAGPRQQRGAAGEVRLATVEIQPLRAGLLEIRLDGLKFVDSTGRPIQVALPSTTLSVQVGEPAAGPRLSAPASPWQLRPRAPALAGAGAPRDITGDGLISHADARELALDWDIARERGQPCGQLASPASDINGDGCLDVGDIQALASGYSPPQQPAVSPQAALTLVVNSTADSSDADTRDGACATAAGTCTLRAAIQQANAHPGPDVINFNIAGDGVKSIQLTQALPTLRDETGGTTINGYSQPGARPNSDPLASNAVIRIQIAGEGTYGFEAFRIISAQNVLRGLALYNLFRPIWLDGPGANDNRVLGNFIGTNAAGSFRSTGTYTDASGVLLWHGASRNRIGSAAPADRNVIAGLPRSGVGMWNEGTRENVVQGNLVGYTPDGQARLSNTFHGIDLNTGASANLIGGLGPGERNVVCCSARRGIEISHSGATSGNRVLGNFIGTDLTGQTAPSWAYVTSFGINVKDRVRDNEVAYNVVGNARGAGIRIDEYSSCCLGSNWFHNNRVGVSADGSAIPNRVAGFYVTAGNAVIGPGNLIAHNPIGVRIEGPSSDHNQISRNAIYANGGLGIDLEPIGQVNLNDRGDGDGGANQGQNFPELQAADQRAVRGSACAGCTVEIFLADAGGSAYGEGRALLGTAVAGADGSFVAAISGAAPGDYVTATATSSTGNTSEFARNLLVAALAGRDPLIERLAPNTAVAGDPGLALSVTGANFAPNAVLRWNGQSRPTSVASATQLVATISAADLAAAGSARVSVLNPSGGQISNELSFTIKQRAPVSDLKQRIYLPAVRR